MNDNEKIISMLEILLVRTEKLEKTVEKLEKDMSAVKKDISVMEKDISAMQKNISEIPAIKESLEETRSGVNTLLAWADKAEHVVKVPLMEYA